MRLCEKSAVRATQESSGVSRVRIGEGVPSVELLLQFPLAAWASKLPIKSIEPFSLCLKNVLVAFYCFPSDKWV